MIEEAEGSEVVAETEGSMTAGEAAITLVTEEGEEIILNAGVAEITTMEEVSETIEESTVTISAGEVTDLMTMDTEEEVAVVETLREEVEAVTLTEATVGAETEEDTNNKVTMKDQEAPLDEATVGEENPLLQCVEEMSHHNLWEVEEVDPQT